MKVIFINSFQSTHLKMFLSVEDKNFSRRKKSFKDYVISRILIAHVSMREAEMTRNEQYIYFMCNCSILSNIYFFLHKKKLVPLIKLHYIYVHAHIQTAMINSLLSLCLYSAYTFIRDNWIFPLILINKKNITVQKNLELQ